jgi:hypothetical protein
MLADRLPSPPLPPRAYKK